MKRLLLLVLVSGALRTASAQIPGTLSYQGILIDQATGNPVANGQHFVKFNFYDALTGGNLKYSSTGTGSGNSVQTFKGMFTFVIGSGSAGNNPIPIDPSDPNYIGGQQLYVEVVYDVTNTLSPRIALTPVPYAYTAQNANAMNGAGLTGTVPNTVLDADLQDLADGSLSGSKIGTGISASNVTTGTLTGSLVGTGVSASNITTGTLLGSLIGTGINAANITTGTITSAQITDGTVATADIANNAVTTAKMATSGVVANTYGSATNIPVITVDVSGRITGVTNTALSAGTVTTVTAGAPLSVLNGTTTPALSIAKATGTTDGYLASTDWTTFNAKQSTVTASNGLTIATNNLTLGGTLTSNTTIANAGFNINVAGAGGLGIGAPTPLSKLDVGGGTSIGNGYAGTVAAPTNGLIVQGNVGIGNSAPAQRLDVTGNVNFTGALMANSLAGTSGQLLTSAGAGVVPTWNNPTWITTGSVITNNPTGNNVSIGTTTATFPFEINRSTGATTAKFGASNPVCFVANSPMVGFNMAHNGGYQLQSAAPGGIITFSQEVSGGFSFNTAPTGAALSFPTVTSRMAITNAGNVGIGTTSPSTLGLLHVAGSDVAVDGTLYKGMVWANGNTMQAHLFRYGQSNNNLYVTNNGPSDLTGVYLASGATSWTSTSDRRMKENIRETKYGLSTVLRIPVREFNFKTSKEKNVVGFIAQEVYPIIPELVEKGDDGEFVGSASSSSSANSTFRPWGVDYGGLTPVLVKAIQEQQKQIEELKASNAQLKAQVSQVENLTAQVEILKKLVLGKEGPLGPDAKSTTTGSLK